MYIALDNGPANLAIVNGDGCSKTVSHGRRFLNNSERTTELSTPKVSPIGDGFLTKDVAAFAPKVSAIADKILTERQPKHVAVKAPKVFTIVNKSPLRPRHPAATSVSTIVDKFSIEPAIHPPYTSESGPLPAVGKRPNSDLFTRSAPRRHTIGIPSSDQGEHTP